jgi:hypothetical protein
MGASFLIIESAGDRVPDSYVETAVVSIPTSFSAPLNIPENTVDLTWVNPIERIFDRVMIRESTTDHPATPAAGNLVYEGPLEAYAHATTLYEVHYYSIWSVSTEGDYSAKVESQSGQVAAPPDITDLVVDTDFAESKVVLTWTNTGGTFDHVEIYESESGYPTVPGADRLVYSGALETVDDPGLLLGVLHYYAIWSVNSVGGYSDNADTGISEILGIPDAITDFGVETVFAEDKATLTWTNPAGSFDHVEIYESETGYPTIPGEDRLVYSGPLETFDDEGLDLGVVHYYSIWTANVENAYSLTADTGLTTLLPLPDAITDLEVISDFLNEKVTLNWTNTGGSFDHVEIYASNSGYPTIPGADRLVYSGSAETADDLSVEFDILHYYAIWAVNALDEYSLLSDTGITEIEGLPAAITDLGLVMNTEAGSITLSWTNPGGTFHHVELYESEAGYPVTPGAGRLVYSGPNETVDDLDLDLDPIHYYAIWTVNCSDAYSATSDTVASTDVFGPDAIFPFVATPGPDLITLTWTNPTAADFAGVTIRRSSSDYPATPTSGTPVYHNSGHSYVDAGLVYGTTYFYSAWAYDEVPNYSEVAHATGTPAPNYAVEARLGPVGLIQALTQAIGESDTEIGGFRLTRLSAVANVGATTFSVESTSGWDESGKVGIDGVLYSYAAKTLASLTGITHSASGVTVAGARVAHRIEAVVADCSRTSSAVDLCRRAMLVEYAEAEDLSVIGRNLGVNRLVFFSEDAQYRRLIKAMAYNPKGTTFGVELVLNAILGEGNYELWEDLIQHPCILYVYIPVGEIMGTSFIGRAFLDAAFYGVTSGAGKDTIVMDHAPLFVGTVRLLDLGELFDFRVRIPGAITYLYHSDALVELAAFTYSGASTPETDFVAVVSAQACSRLSTFGATVFYTMADTQGARVAAVTEAEVSWLISVSGAVKTGELAQASITIFDGAYQINLGLDTDGGTGIEIGLYATSGGGFLGSTFTGLKSTWYEVSLRKHGADTVELWVDGDLVATVAYGSFTAATTDHKIEWGIRGAPSSGLVVDTKQLGVQLETATDFWNARGALGVVGTANPTRFSDGGAAILSAGDVGSYLEITGSGIENAQGGNNNGQWEIDTLVSPGIVTLKGAVHLAVVSFLTAYPTRITVEDLEAFSYPDDLGKQIVITDSELGNNGTYVISDLLEVGTLLNLDEFETPVAARTNVCEVVSASFVSEYRASYQLFPIFSTETGLDWELSDAGSFTDETITLRQGGWGTALVMRVGIEDMLSGQLLPDAGTFNELLSEAPEAIYRYYPFYLYDPFATAESYLDSITAAGVLTQFVTVIEGGGIVRLVEVDPGPLALNLEFNTPMLGAGPLLDPASYTVTVPSTEEDWDVDTELV